MAFVFSMRDIKCQEDAGIGKCLLGDEISSAREAKVILRQENVKERNRS